MKSRLFIPTAAVLLSAAIPLQTASARRGDPDPERTPTTLPVPAGIQWLTSLDQGYKDAAKYQRPMLVIYGAQWCAPCRALAEELEKPDVRDKLAGWTLVHLDVDKPEPGAEAYSGPIPALRLLSSQGKKLASREGYTAGAELLKWMQENVPSAIPVDPDLVGDAAPDAAALGRLVTKLCGPDASAREAAASRLARWPAASAPAVSEAFATGNLRARLAALELLQDWKAPVGGIDPWQPQTIDAAHLDALRKWAAAVKPPPATQPSTTQPATLDASRMATVQMDMTRLLATADPGEAGIIATRLARMGPGLLPTVAEKEKVAASDRQRERLTALRYRVVATPALTQQWPGGLDRLASSDLQTRHLAAEELAGRATIDEMPLLLSLFSDPDPLVRELSLKSLQKIGGSEGTAALVKLLHDPTPNVRAAVLKQLAESPTPEIADAVIAYIVGEKDNDLVVHAVRVLKAAGGDNATNSLVSLTAHESWRVRAEAIDALSDMAIAQRGTPNEKVSEAVMKRIDDPDSFVVGRALAAMKALGSGLSEKALSNLASKRPELAGEVLKLVMAEVNNSSSPQVDIIRNMCASESPAIRAAAVVGLANVRDVDCEKEVTAALADKVETVRAAGAQALLEVLNSLLPKDGYVNKSSFLGFGGGRTKVDPAAWITDFRAGKGRPPWIDKCLPELTAMLKSADRATQRTAALPMISLGHDDEALPIIMDAAKTDDDGRSTAAGALPWLPWEKSVALFKVITATEPSDHLMATLISSLTLTRDLRAADLLWDQLSADRSQSTAEAIFRGLQLLYLNQEYYNGGDVTPDQAKPLIDAVQPRLTSGTEWQKTIAMGLLLAGAKGEAKTQSRKIYDDEKNPADLRAAGFQIFLLAAEPAEAQQFAADSLGSGKLAAPLQRIAIMFLARGGQDLSALPNGLWVQASSSRDYDYGRGQVRVIKVPAGVKAEPLLPFIQNGDPLVAGYSGYLLCLVGKKEGLPPLLKYWREHKDSQSDLSSLIYTAITALDDDSQTPVLEEIYKSMGQQSYELREFYWTIRAMHGPNILALRKKMRDEVGMERLQ